MREERQVELLRDEIDALLAPLSGVAGFYDLVKEPLAEAKRGLASGSACGQPWSLLPLLVCEAISGCYEQALPVAASLEFLTAAGNVFDDIEDADSPESLSARYGSAIATNVATALLILAERGITRLKGRGIEDYMIVHIMDTVNSLYTTACAGQHLDLSLDLEMAVSEDVNLRVIDMKSASQIECACRTGALLATANKELISTFAMFGHNLGMASQITNDIQGITNGSDIVKRKITLPVIFALAQTDGEARNQLEATFVKQSEPMPDHIQIRGLLFRSGAIHYATIKMEFYKQRALEILSEAERAGASVERLKSFLK